MSVLAGYESFVGVVKLGLFYLGRRHDIAAGTTRDEPVLYDSRDLVTHAVCIGMIDITPIVAWFLIGIVQSLVVG